MRINLVLGLPEPEEKNKVLSEGEKPRALSAPGALRKTGTLVNKELIASELVCRLEPVLHRLCNR